MPERRKFLPPHERVADAVKIVGAAFKRDAQAAVDSVEEARRQARKPRPDPLANWKDDLRDFIKVLEPVQKITGRLRRKMPRPELLDELDHQCAEWIARCRGQLSEAELPGLKAARHPRRHDADVKRLAAERARSLLTKRGLPLERQHELAKILFGDGSADLGEYCGPQIVEAVGLAGRFFYDFPQRGARARRPR
jgi:hypothetical protein